MKRLYVNSIKWREKKKKYKLRRKTGSYQISGRKINFQKEFSQLAYHVKRRLEKIFSAAEHLRDGISQFFR